MTYKEFPNNKIYLIDNLGDRLDSIAVPTQVLDMDWNPSGNKLSVVYDFSDLRIFIELCLLFIVPFSLI